MEPSPSPTVLPRDPRVIALLETAGVWMWETDLAQETTTFQDGFWEQYGVQRADVEETFEFIRVMEREDMPAVVKAWRAHLDGDAPLYESEWRLRLPGGGHRWISARGRVFERDATGKPVRLVGIYRDVSNERAAEEELRTSAAELDALFGGAPHGIVLIAPDLTVVRLNDQARTLIRLFSDAEVGPGFDIRQLARKGPERPVLEDILKVLTGERVPDRTVRLSPSQQHIEVTYAPIGDGGVGAVVTVRDVSERVRGEQSRAQALRLESLGLMAGGVAHDFNNLLAAIVGNIDVALVDMKTGDAAEGLAEARSAALRASEMVNQLLAFAGQNEPVASDVDVSDLVAEIVRYARRIPGVTATIEEELAAALPEIRADSTQLRQVALNLIVNALDATRESGSRVTVRTRLATQVQQAGGPVLEGRQAARYLVMEVEDDGPGMDEPTRHRIFDPFFTTKPDGHGLGLASVLGAVRAHGGTLTVLSELGHGARFTVYLPLPG